MSCLLELARSTDAAVEYYHNKPRPLESPTSKYHAVDETVGISSFRDLSSNIAASNS